MEIVDVERTMIEVGNRFPSVVLTKSVSPMNKIKGLTTKVFEVQNRIDEILGVTINNDFRRRG